jgi:hypothetical protein
MESHFLTKDWHSLFGKSITDPEIQSILDSQKPQKFETKSFKDNDATHEYHFSYTLGLSLSFRDSIFVSVFLYGKFDKKFKKFEGALPYHLTFDMNNVDLVSFLGEPNKKTAGRTVPITLTYERLGIEFTFMSPVWDLVDNKIGFICLFPKEKSNPENTICALCTKPASSFCAQCRLVSYCTRTCQSTHWKVHKGHCNKYFKNEDASKAEPGKV